MRSVHVSVDVSAAMEGLGEVSAAATVHLPDELRQPATVMFGFPGGGFGRRYFDIQAMPGYSQAAHHTAHGFVFVACDHVHVGDSSHPDTFGLTFENLAAANHITTTHILEGLHAGTLVEDLGPIHVERVVGMGQSMGGCLLTVQQARHHTYDGVAFLGWSGIYTNFPAPDGTRQTYPLPPRGTDIRPIADEVLGATGPGEDHFRFCFHWPDEEPELMEADLASYRPYTDVERGDEVTPWGSSTIPACAVTMMTPGAVSAEAAAIEVPVLVACGERDTVPEPSAEPGAYSSSRDVRVEVVPAMAHMHNFSRNRTVLWDLLEEWARAIPTGAST